MVVVIMGVSGSGKTTIGALLAKRLGWSFHDADDYHSAANKEKMSRGIPLTDEDRIEWLSALRELIAHEIPSHASQRHAVLACSALKEMYRERLHVNDQVQFVYLRETYEQIKARLKSRKGHYMKPAMLKSQFAILEEPDTAITVDVTCTPNEIVNIICKELDL